MKILTVSIVLAMAGTAYADQCEWIDAKVAAKAKLLVEGHPKVIAFCELCGDKAPGLPEAATRVEIGTPNPGYKDVRINGTPVDLAYTYVQTSPGTYKNLALLSGCEATGVSPSLKVADETPNGVLITPDDLPTTPPTPPPQAAQPMVLTLPTVTQATTPQIVVVETRPAFPWAMIALAGITGFGATLFGVLTIAALRRKRRAMRPRATELRTDTADK
jgi:hypothetical protein